MRIQIIQIIQTILNIFLHYKAMSYYYAPNYLTNFFSQYIHVDFYIHKSILACFAGIIVGNVVIYLVRIYSGEIKFNAKKNLPY
jgi:hypothetical protein